MIRNMMVWLCCGVIMVFMNSANTFSQTSSSYRLEEFTFNNGGHPAEGTTMTSSNFSMTLDAVGEALVSVSLASPSHNSGAGFVPPYPPPGEVLDITFVDRDNFVWEIEHSIGHYNVYRGEVDSLPADYGTCQATRMTAEAMTDPETPPSGHCFFYLVTSSNFLYEEGSMGFDSLNNERVNSTPCN